MADGWLVPAERRLGLLHVAFLAAAAAVVGVVPGPLGWRAIGVLVVYDLAVVVLARRTGDAELFAAWRFAAILSVWQILPDAVLADGLGVLEFPPDGAPDIGPVTLPMALMWTVPVVIVLAAGRGVEERRGRRAGAVAVAAVGFVLFLTAEAVLTALPVWRTRNVTAVGGVALYILPAEVFFAVLAHEMHGATRGRGLGTVVAATFVVMLAYTGAATVSWWLFQGPGL